MTKKTHGERLAVIEDVLVRVENKLDKHIEWEENKYENLPKQYASVDRVKAIETEIDDLKGLHLQSSTNAREWILGVLLFLVSAASIIASFV